MTAKLAISDHAILRWLERVEGVDVAAIRKRIHNSAYKALEYDAPRIKLDGVEFSISYEDPETAVVVTTFSSKPRPHLAVDRIGDHD